MTGTCPCGGWQRESSHIVKTAKKAAEWGATEDQLPIQVVDTLCHACGRGHTDIFTGRGVLIKRFG